MRKSQRYSFLVLFIFCGFLAISLAEDVNVVQSKINSTILVIDNKDSELKNVTSGNIDDEILFKNVTSEKIEEGVLLKNGSREGRGILDTVKTLIQTAQTVNKLFGNSNSNTNTNNNGNNHYYPNQQQQQQQQQHQNLYPGNSQNNYYQNQNQNVNHNPNVNYQGVLSASNNYNNYSPGNPGDPGTFTDYYGQTHQLPVQQQQHQQQQQQIPSPIYQQNPIGSASQLHPNYQSFPVSSSLNFQNNNPNSPNSNQMYPGSVSNAPIDTGVYNNIPVNKQGHGSPISPINSLGNSPLNSIGGGGGALLSQLGSLGGLGALGGLSELGVVDDLSELFSFGNVEKVLTNVNKFDSLQCIPRLVCQTIARRHQETAEKEREAARTSTTTTTTTRRPKNKGRKNKNDKDKDGANGRNGHRSARLIPGLKIQGMDTALEQVVKFLDLMQLKDWSLYPYLQGAYHGNQVRTWDECAEKFSTCPFSEDQLLYYFNNYKGGLFQSFRSDLQSTLSS